MLFTFFYQYQRFHCLTNAFNYCLQPTPTPKRPNEDDSDSDEEPSRSKVRRKANQNTDHVLYRMSKGLPKEPTITDKEREDILRFVETEVTEV